MRRIITALVAALESFATALAGLGLIALPVFLLTVITVGVGADAAAIGGLIASLWLLAHGVPFSITLEPESALGFGLPAEALSFPFSLVPLGITALTLFFAFRAGWRLANRPADQALLGLVAGTLAFAGTAWLLALLGRENWAVLPVWAAAAIPAAVYLCAALLGVLLRGLIEGKPWLGKLLLWSGRTFGEYASTLRIGAGEALRLAAGTGLGLVALAGVAFVAALFAGFVEISTLSQQLHLDGLGSVIMLLLNLSYLPTFLIWTLAWFAGPGFALGSGSSVTPFETLLGPVPALPVFGALPGGWGDWGALAPLTIVLLGLILSLLFLRPMSPVEGTLDPKKRPQEHEEPGEPAEPDGVDARDEIDAPHPIAGNQAEETALLTNDDDARRSARMLRICFARSASASLAAAVLLGVLGALLAVFASGGIGPDRLQDLGVSPWHFGGFLTLELFIGFLLGMVIRAAASARGGLAVSMRRKVGTPDDQGAQGAQGAQGRPSPIEQGDRNEFPHAELSLGEQTVDHSPQPDDLLEGQTSKANPRRAESHVRLSGSTGPTLSLPGDTQALTSPLADFNTAIADSQVPISRHPGTQASRTADPSPLTHLSGDLPEPTSITGAQESVQTGNSVGRTPPGPPRPGILRTLLTGRSWLGRKNSRSSGETEGSARGDGFREEEEDPLHQSDPDSKDTAVGEEAAATVNPVVSAPSVLAAQEPPIDPTQERLRRESEQAQQQNTADFVPWWRLPTEGQQDSESSATPRVKDQGSQST